MASNPETGDDGSTVGIKVSSRKRPRLERGTCVERYVVLDPLGEGGMGVVYKAYDPELDRTVALKLLKSDRQGALRDRLLREAQALARLSHPNVVAVHDVGTFRTSVFIAMEFVAGKTAREWLKERPRSLRDILDVYCAAGEGLVAAHRAGLVHRDFKPDNVLVADDGRVRVVDFGLARATGPLSEEPETQLPSLADEPTGAPPSTPPPAVDDDHVSSDAPRSADGASGANGSSRSHSSRQLDRQLTREGAVMGTPRFMAPEQHLGQVIDERADQFSFCVALFEALYGALPFAGDNVDDLADSVVNGRRRELPKGAVARVPARVRQALQRGLATRPADRFPSMDALLVALRPDLARRRRIGWSLAALAVVAGVVGAGAWRLGHRSRLGMCTGAEHKLAGVWDDAQRGRVRAAFGKSGRVFAAPVLHTVEAALDSYAAAWVAMHVDACEATHLRAEQSQELLDLRMSCLDERLTELRTLSSELAEADGALVERAAKAAQSLPRIERCGDVAALRAPIPPPADVATRSRVEAIRQQLARSEALELAGKFPEELRLARGALAAATAVGYDPLTGEAHFRVGRAQLATGEFAPSAESLHHAFVAALAGRHDELAANVAVALVSVVGEREGHFDEGARFADVAQALAGRVHDRDELLGGIANRRSALLLRQGKPNEALVEAERGLEYFKRSSGKNQQQLADAYHGVANAYYESGRYREAIANFQHALALSEAALGREHPRVAVLLLNMAAAYGDSGDHAGALTQSRRTLAIFQRNEGTPPGYIANTLNNMGDDLRAIGELGPALDSYRRALVLWREGDGSDANATEIAVARHNIAEVKLEQGDVQGALADFRALLAEREKRQGASHPDVAFEQWGVAEAQRRLGHLDDADGRFAQALALWEKALGREHPYLQQALLGLGRVRLAHGQLDAANALLQRAKAIGDAQPADDYMAGQIRLALANAQWGLGHREAARQLASESRKRFANVGARGTTAGASAATWLAEHPLAAL